MRLPRPRFTLMFLMILVVIASLAMTGVVVLIEVNRRIAALQVATAEYENAKLTRQVAMIAAVEYTEGIYKQDLQTVNDELTLAKSDLERKLNPRDSDDRAVEQARDRLEQAQQKKTRLETYAKKVVKDLDDEVTKVAAAEQAAKAAYDQLKAAVANPWW
jgi:ribosomal protein S20